MKNVTNDNQIYSISDFRLPRYGEITDVGLYLEQTVRFINAYLAPLGEPEITVSMVSNYVKQKLIDAPVKKQYHTGHIASLFFIAVAKTVASLDDIRIMLDLQRNDYPIQLAYDHFCGEFEAALRACFGLSEPVAAAASRSEYEALLSDIIVAAVRKIYLDKRLAAVRAAK